MEDYYLVVSLIVIATLCWMAGVVKVVLALTTLCVALSLAQDSGSRKDMASDRLVWTAYVLSRDGSVADIPRRRHFDPLLDLDPVGVMHYWGYPGERHWVETDDGYVLGVHRLPGPRRGAQDADADPNDVDSDDADKEDVDPERPARKAGRPAVILAHPLLSSSAEWLVTGPGNALAFLLADAGYDVWLFNVRGNTFSVNHTTLSVNDAAFWDFTFHEHALHDMPAMIKYVVRETGQQTIQYVGFSMGTTIMFIMASERPDVAKHISLFTALGPVAALSHSRSRTFRALTQLSPMLVRVSRLFGVHRFLPSSSAIKAAGEYFCADGCLTQPLCTGLIAALSGRNDAQMNTTMLPYAIARTPSGTSFKNIDHFSQVLRRGFQAYDHGTVENRRRYGQDSPPKYNVSNMRVPIRLHYGLNDHLADYKDTEALCPRLPNVLSCEPVADPLWTHLDFVWARDAPNLVYSKIIAGMEEFRTVA